MFLYWLNSIIIFILTGKAHQNRNFPKEMTDRNLGARMLTRLWGATGEQEWTPALTTGNEYYKLVK